MSGVENIEQYVSPLKVVELREELRKRHLSYAGNKKELAQRLQESMLKEKEEQESAEEKTPAEAEEEESADKAEVEEAEPSDEKAEEVADMTENNEKEEEQEVEPTVEEEETPVAEEEGAPSTEDSEEELPSYFEIGYNREATLPEEEVPKIIESTSTTMDEPVAGDEAEVAEQKEEEEEKETKDEEQVEEEVTATGGEASGEGGESMETGDGEGEKVDGEQEEKQETSETVTTTTDETEQMETTAATQEKEEDAKPEETKDEDDVTKEGGGVKRQHEDEDVKADKDDEKSDKVDPSKAPDPEEPEKFDESAIKSDFEEQFNPPEDDVTITLDRYNSDLHFKINTDGLGGCNLTEHGFAFLWASARATWGVKGGKYYYEVRVEENLEVELPDTEEHPHAIRVGWSLDVAELGLGEVPNSYGYGGTGKSSSNNKFESYGESYGPGDVIGCFLDRESTPATVSFSKNGQHLGTAFTLEDEELKDKALFPHVSTKNVKMTLNFSSPAWSEVEGMEGYLPLQEATEEQKIRATKGPAAAAECEVYMMIGLPASGKTTWAEKHCQEHPEKRFTILGTNLIMDKMKVTGLGRKQNYHGRWEALIKQSTDVLNAMFLLAGKNLRNYIIDQTNVYDGAQRRKMSYFDGFNRKAVIVVPPHHVLRQRTAKRNSEMGQPVPDEAVNAMKANFHVPRKGGLFDDVVYAEIYGVAADKIVRQYREDALGLPSYPTTKRGRYDNRSPVSGGGRYGPPRGGGRGGGGGGGGGYSPYSYNRPPYGYGYSRGPPYSPYGHPPPPPHMYGHGPPPRRGGYHHPPYSPRPYGGRGGYGPPPPHRGGYYGRY